jgi:hypothetical protein
MNSDYGKKATCGQNPSARLGVNISFSPKII